MRRSKGQTSFISQNLDTRPQLEAERAFDRMLRDFWDVHQKIIAKMQNCETPSAEELAEAALNQRLLAERLQYKREQSAKAAKQLLDAIDLEP